MRQLQLRRLDHQNLSENGMSLIEIMIGLGIASIMTLAVMMMAQLSSQVIGNNRLENDFNTKVTMARMILSQEEWCKTSLRTGPLGSGSKNGQSLNTFDISLPPPRIYGILEVVKNPSTGGLEPKTSSVPSDDLLLAQSLEKVQDGSQVSRYPGYVLPMPTETPAGIAIEPPSTTNPSLLPTTTRTVGGVLLTFRTFITKINITQIRLGTHIGTRQVIRSIPIEFTLGPIDGPSPTPNSIFSCQSRDIIEESNIEAACNALGGEYISSATPKCLLKRLGISDTPSDRDSNTPSVGIYSKGNILSNGRIGVGTTSPQRELSVVGNISAESLTANTGDTYSLLANIADNKAFSLGYISNTNNPYLTFNFDSPIGTGSALMTLTNSGNLGIGTSTPTKKLDINGDIEANGNLSIKGATALKIDASNAYLFPNGTGRTPDTLQLGSSSAASNLNVHGKIYSALQVESARSLKASPGSAFTAGGNCTSEGAGSIAFDNTNDRLIYCNTAKVWTRVPTSFGAGLSTKSSDPVDLTATVNAASSPPEWPGAIYQWNSPVCPTNTSPINCGMGLYGETNPTWGFSAYGWDYINNKHAFSALTKQLSNRCQCRVYKNVAGAFCSGSNCQARCFAMCAPD